MRELRYFKTQRNLKNAIELAALAKTPRGTRHDHQRRLTKRSLASAYRRLLSAKHRIAKCLAFEELITLIDKLVRPIYGIGELYVYDVSTRIGAYLNCTPNTFTFMQELAMERTL